MMRGGMIATAAMAACLTVAGCGGDDNGSSDAEATVTKAEYVTSVKAVCGDYTQERHAAEQPLADLFKDAESAGEVPPAQLKAASEDLIALNATTRQLLIDLSDLPRPAGDEAALDQVFANFDDAQAALDRADMAATEGDGAGIDAAFKDFDAALNRNRDVSDEFGFSACG